MVEAGEVAAMAAEVAAVVVAAVAVEEAAAADVVKSNPNQSIIP